jgi:alkanesulfonate monooxygenase SsuD/methylene tetrahydromethanopterin reductase-like flavin-dependent oxidoreductase (luciferase family)
MRLSIFSVLDHYPALERTVPGFYAETLAQADLADALGYDTNWIAEHHFHANGVVPNPAVILAAIARGTSRLKLGTAISALNFHDARVLAETYAMLDALSGGRLMYGVGSGYLPHEFEGFGVDPAQKRERFDEAVAAVELLLTGERASFEGRHQSFRDIQLNVTPAQKRVPLYVGVLRKEAAYHVGRQGRNLLCVPYASVENFDGIAEIVDEFRRGREEAGAPAGDNDLVVALHAHVAASDAAAREGAEIPFNRYVESRLYARKATYDDVLKSGLHLCGGIDRVAAKLARLRAMGVGHVAALHNFGAMSDALTRRSMEALIAAGRRA